MIDSGNKSLATAFIGMSFKSNKTGVHYEIISVNIKTNIITCLEFEKDEDEYLDIETSRYCTGKSTHFLRKVIVLLKNKTFEIL